MTWLRSGVGGRRATLALGGVYMAVAVAWLFIGARRDTTIQATLIISTLVGAAGLALFYGSYRLPQTDINPKFYPTIATWCFRGIAVMVGILIFIGLVDELNDPAANFLILPALAAVAGFGAGQHDARAKTRTHDLEQRNQELQETQAELEETVGQLKESEQRYRTLTENFPNGAVALLDTELRHTLIAGQGFEEVDFCASDIRGERVQDVFSEDFNVIEKQYRTTLDGKPTLFEVEMQGRTFEFRTHPLTSESGDVYAVLSMSQDITDRKEREQELTKRARQQQVVADLSQFALETTNLDGLMDEAAKQVANVLDAEYCKVLEFDENTDELVLRQGVGWADGLVGEATVSAVESDSQAAYTLTSELPIVVEDLETETRFGGPDLLREHHVRSGISTVIGPVSDPWGILGVHDTDQKEFSEEDVTFVKSVATILADAIERHQYQSDLEQTIADLETSNERLEQFAYAASHDLQEPLRMVSSYLQLIESRYGDELDEDGKEFLEFAVNGAERMRSMINGLLQYSRVEIRGDPFDPVDLETVLENVRDDLQMQISESQAEITTEPLPRVHGDDDQLRQVFQNLLTNAIQYSGEEPPSIHVSAERNGTEWIVSVQDEGIGIDPEDTERIFDVFDRLHSPEEYDGSGIGLAVCQRIIERHDGEIWAESEPGEGSTFSFTLPTVNESG